MSLARKITLHALVAAVLAFLVLPILAVIPASLNSASFIRLPPSALSLRWYGAFFQDGEWTSSLLTSAKVAAIATGLSLFLGTAAALGLRRIEGAWRRILSGFFLAPLIVPAIVTAIALYYVSRPLGLVGTTIGLALGHALLCLPFVVVNVGVSLAGLDPILLRAAEGLGASPFRIFRTVTVPSILPGLVGGAIFAAITSFDEVVISIFLAGIEAKTLPVKMWETIRVEFTPVAAVAATLLIGLTLVFFLTLHATLLRSRRPKAA
ncbi:MAG TPA: ABC transporter permease [Alphaproteobacteria bacterium]|nr:ABC transporter permease [Alphaproteobacteria bacterium]